jgi:hypothetical protein
MEKRKGNRDSGQGEMIGFCHSTGHGLQHLPYLLCSHGCGAVALWRVMRPWTDAGRTS